MDDGVRRSISYSTPRDRTARRVSLSQDTRLRPVVLGYEAHGRRSNGADPAARQQASTLGILPQEARGYGPPITIPRHLAPPVEVDHRRSKARRASESAVRADSSRPTILKPYSGHISGQPRTHEAETTSRSASRSTKSLEVQASTTVEQSNNPFEVARGMPTSDAFQAILARSVVREVARRVDRQVRVELGRRSEVASSSAERAGYAQVLNEVIDQEVTRIVQEHDFTAARRQ